MECTRYVFAGSRETVFFSRFPDAQPMERLSVHAASPGHGRFIVHFWRLGPDGRWYQVSRPEKRSSFGAALSLVPPGAVEDVPDPDFALRIFSLPARGNS